MLTPALPDFTLQAGSAMLAATWRYLMLKHDLMCAASLIQVEFRVLTAWPATWSLILFTVTQLPHPVFTVLLRRMH